ncbi:MAG: hypothetical protein HQ582_33955 [Planctomycetes bacterium]|nr:hypothetical protein [Planctomycetota bacterium]
MSTGRARPGNCLWNWTSERGGGPRLTTLLLLFAVLFPAAVLAQADAPDDDLKLQVRRLLRQLDASQLALRDEAEEKLLELGPAILDRLPKKSARVSAEVAERVERIRQKLQRAMAENAGQASPVTLQGEMPLSEILSKIQEQTGNKIVLRGPGGQPGDQDTGPKLSVDFDKTPFWQALDQVLDQASLGAYPYGDEKAVYVVPRGGPASSPGGGTCYSGPFRFQPVTIRAQRDLRDPTSGSLRLTLEVSWEPRLAPVTILQRMADVEAFDENGESLPIDGPEAVSEVFVTPNSVAGQLDIPLELPPRDVKQIARLKGTLNVLLPSEVATFRFGNLEEAKLDEKRIAGVTVVLVQARKNRKAWEIAIRVRFDEAAGALESHLNWIDDNEIFLEDPDGKPISAGMSTSTGRKENEVGLAYYFSVDGPLTGYSLVYKTPALILSGEFDYEIEDIDLP